MLISLSLANPAFVNLGVRVPDEEVVREALLVYQKQI